MGRSAPVEEAAVDELLAYRDRFPTLARGPYFAAHTLGPMPDTAPDALARFTAEWAEQGVVAWTGWLEQIRATAALLEGLFAAPAGSVALGPNVSVPAGQLPAGGVEVLHHQLHPLDRAGGAKGQALADHHRAGRPGRGHLHHPQPVVGAGVVVQVEADLLDVEGLGGVDVGDGDGDDLELHVHQASLPRGGAGR